MSEILNPHSQDDELVIVSASITRLVPRKKQSIQQVPRAKSDYEKQLDTEKKKYELQLVNAHEMRRSAKARLMEARSAEVWNGVKSTTLTIVGSQFATDLNGQERRIFYPKERFSAYLVDPRFHAATGRGEGSPRRLYFSPIFLGSDGELWIIQIIL